MWATHMVCWTHGIFYPMVFSQGIACNNCIVLCFFSINKVEKFPLEWFSSSFLSNISSIFLLSLCANNSKWDFFCYLDLGWNVTWLTTFFVILCIPKSYIHKTHQSFRTHFPYTSPSREVTIIIHVTQK